MRKFDPLFCFMVLAFLLSVSPAGAQSDIRDTVVKRLLFIGDAGKLNADQQAVIKHSSEQVLPGRTTVIFLGDNIFPGGMGIDPQTGEAQKQGQAALVSQYQPFRQKGAALYFLPGNRDWDNGGPAGLSRVKEAADYIQQKQDAALQWVPAGGCPDPVAIPVTDKLVIIAMDTQWWLYPFNKDNVGAECNCQTTRDVLASLRELLYKNRYKTIILATHHPFASYGTHGGYFNWKDHIFPLTAIQKNLYLPLPAVGSLYPLFRKAFMSPQDLKHPLNTQMRQSVQAVFKDFPNLIHVSGHEEGLQLIDIPKEDLFQIISGSGSETNYTFKGRHSLFAAQATGFVELDQMSSGYLRIRFYGKKAAGADPDTTTEHGWGVLFSKQYQPRPYEQLEQKHQKAVDTDSFMTAVHPAYDNVSNIHRFLFGHNYRQAWATPVKLPVIRISDVDGGLTPLKLGGGFQSTSLRFASKSGKEYTLRSVEKRADLIVPDAFSGTFVKEWLDDATSAQHPYAALVVPPLAEAVGVAHTDPVIGVVAPDSALEAYGGLFEGKVNLLEEREPLGETDNTEKALRKLQDDNDNNFDAKAFLRARGLDYLMADWDRHADQWRFHNTGKKGEDKYYIPIPRDRDMVLNVTQGLIPDIAKHFVLMPRVFGFSAKDPLRGSNYYFYKSAFLNQHPSAQMDFATWHDIAVKEQNQLTDTVLRAALDKIPKELSATEHARLLEELKARRDHLTKAMDKYYRLSNKYVDIRASDKNELVSIQGDSLTDGLRITLQKISKHGEVKDTLMSKVYSREMTREIRLYLGRGDDSVYINNPASTVGLRIIGGRGHKKYRVQQAYRRVRVYDHELEKYEGDAARLKVRVSADSAHTAFVPTDLYNTAVPLLTGAYNADDGLFLGIGARLTLQNGFRKTPYSSVHQLLASHSFATNAFRIKYSGIWTKVLGGADFTFDADIKAPNNTQNFFGRGNETVLSKKDDYKRFYRIRFNTIDLAPALRWQTPQGTSFSLGPAFQYYHMAPGENDGRFIQQTSEVKTYDSATLLQDKIHLGVQAVYELDHRNNKVLPQWGTYLRLQLNGYKGINDVSRSYARLLPELALYKSLNARSSLVLSDRVGGGITLGQTTFYQSVFLGGEGSLLGYSKYRFAGQQAVYNNLELRWVLSDFGNYIVKGEVGLTGFYDIGRVWQDGEASDKWHNGVGGGVYFAPASMTVFKFTMGYSPEGWYPNFTMGLRF